MSKERRAPQEWRFTNALMRQAILAIGEVMGEGGLKVVLPDGQIADEPERRHLH
jgi:hypothetical protein